MNLIKARTWEMFTTFSNDCFEIHWEDWCILELFVGSEFVSLRGHFRLVQVPFVFRHGIAF